MNQDWVILSLNFDCVLEAVQIFSKPIPAGFFGLNPPLFLLKPIVFYQRWSLFPVHWTACNRPMGCGKCMMARKGCPCINPTPIPSPKWEGGLISCFLLCFRIRNQWAIWGQAPLPFGGGDGGGVESRAVICTAEAWRYRDFYKRYVPETYQRRSLALSERTFSHRRRGLEKKQINSFSKMRPKPKLEYCLN